jgi:chromate reductase, NAD(P)H dehydrogenase (quinone)
VADYPIAVIVGSLRRGSFNRALATAISRLAPADFSLTQVRIDDLPLYNQDDDEQPAPAVIRLKAEIGTARGVLFVTPEYNLSIPGVLKNAIDHVSRPYGQSRWAGKPAGIIGVSPSRLGTALAQQHLRTILVGLDMPTLGFPEAYIQMRDGLIDPSGAISATSRNFFQDWMSHFVRWVQQHAL